MDERELRTAKEHILTANDNYPDSEASAHKVVTTFAPRLLDEVMRLRALRSGTAIEVAAPDVTINISITTKEPGDVAKAVLEAIDASMKRGLTANG